MVQILIATGVVSECHDSYTCQEEQTIQEVC